MHEITSKHFLVAPKERREEVFEMKGKLKQYDQIKQQTMFVNKRARQLSGGWKLGITGVDTIENPASEIYKN